MQAQGRKRAGVFHAGDLRAKHNERPRQGISLEIQAEDGIRVEDDLMVDGDVRQAAGPGTGSDDDAARRQGETLKGIVQEPGVHRVRAFHRGMVAAKHVEPVRITLELIFE